MDSSGENSAGGAPDPGPTTAATTTATPVSTTPPDSAWLQNLLNMGPNTVHTSMAGAPSVPSVSSATVSHLKLLLHSIH